MRFTKALVAIVGVCALAGMAAGCGSEDDSSAGTGTGGGGESTVKIAVIGDYTGVAGALGTEWRKGVEYAVKKANKSGDVKIEADYLDTGTVPAKAASEMSKAASGDADVAIFGVTSGSAQAIAPIAQKQGIPLILSQSGAPGLVETGDEIFRATAPITTYQNLVIDYMKDQGAKTLATVYTTDNAASTEVATETLPKLAGEAGIEMGSSVPIKLADTDFTAIASKLAKENPDAIYGGMLGNQYAALIKQLARSGWHGLFFGHNGIAFGVLPALGTAGEGVLFTSDFSAATEEPAGKAFAEGFKADTGEEANLFAASGNDAIQLVIAGAEDADGTDRGALKAGLTAATEAGIEGAVGKLRFEDRDARVDGQLVEWTADGEKVVLP